VDVPTIKAFFMWCTIIDGALLVLASLICVLASNWVYRVHTGLFPMSREVFDVARYSFIGLFKILFFVFNVVPYVALLIIG